MLPFVMDQKSLTAAESPTTLRLDPAPSRAYSWLEWRESAEEVRDEATGRVIIPAGPAITVRYRTTGDEQTFWPVSEDEARLVMNPGSKYGYSIGSAMDQVIKKAGKSSRVVKSADRQETRRQREQAEQRAGRRWLA